jgi:hypothetical protein
MICFNKPGLTLRAAIDLAVDAVEVANFIRVEIDPKRNPPGPTAEDGVDESVGFVRPLVLGKQIVLRHFHDVGAAEIGNSS